MDGVSDLWEVKGGSQQKYPNYPEPHCSCRAKKDAGHLSGLEGKVKKKNKGTNINPNLQHTSPTQKLPSCSGNRQPIPQLSIRSVGNKFWMIAQAQVCFPTPDPCREPQT